MPRRAAEKTGKFLTGHALAHGKVEVIHVQPETSVFANINQVLKNRVDIFGFAVWREAHHFVFARIDLETGETRERRIEQTQRVRKLDLFYHLERVVATDRETRGRPLAHAVDRQDSGLLKR